MSILSPALRAGLVFTACCLAGVVTAAEQTLDNICGCKGHPQSLGIFDLRDEKTWPAGSRLEDTTLFLSLPEDGVLVFDGFQGLRKEDDQRHWYIRVERNAQNTPVTLLVAGDFELAPYVDIYLDGSNGEGGSRHLYGRGGAPGPGGFRGGDGAYQAINDAKIGGVGLGPGGGAPGQPEPLTHAESGTFTGSRELRALVGGSGGGGGASAQEGDCSGGGGGGGGGAILIAVNGTLRLEGSIVADGGYGGGPSNSGCASNGGPGSGGGIRLLASRIQGRGWLYARGNRGSGEWKPGVIRIESAGEDELVAHYSEPPALRSMVIAPIADATGARIRIAAVGGETVAPRLKENENALEILLKRPGKTQVQVATQGVPAGTTVEVTLKAKAGGQVLRERGELNPKNCQKDGSCMAILDFEIPSGAWFAEAQATFQAP